METIVLFMFLGCTFYGDAASKCDAVITIKMKDINACETVRKNLTDPYVSRSECTKKPIILRRQ